MKLASIPYKTLLFGPALVFGIGFALNALVMAANSAQMPVLVPGNLCASDPTFFGDDLIHSCMTSVTRLKFLADWIVIRGLGIASPGDFLEWLGDTTYWPAASAWVVLVLRDLGKL